MKAVLLKGLNDLEVGEIPERKLGPYDVRIKTAYNGICGSDRHIIDGNLGAASHYPIIMGHEMSGTIVELGEKATVKGLKVGDNVSGSPAYYCGTCDMCRTGHENFCEQFLANIPQGSMAEYVVWNEQQIFKLPEGVDLESGCFLEPVAAALRGVQRVELQHGMTLCIYGAGPIGLLQVQLAKMCGASTVMMVDIVDEKLALAKEFGADYVVNSKKDDPLDVGMEITEDKGFDRVIEASGSPVAAESAIHLIARGGTINFFAVYPMDYFFPLHLATMYFKEATIKSTFFYPYLFPRAVAMFPRLNVKPLISKVFNLEDGVAAFEADKDNSNYKILIKSN